LYGALFIDNAFESPVFPPGASARVGVLPLKQNWGYLGAELGASWTYLNEKKDRYTVTAQTAGAQMSLLYQLWLPNRTMAFNFRLGAGITVLPDFHFEYGNSRGDTLTGAYVSLNAGASFQWHLRGPFFIDAGADFTHLFSGDPIQPGYLHPALNLGWQF
jgi:hypothetical protein